jgi:hypothetical protein
MEKITMKRFINYSLAGLLAFTVFFATNGPALAGFALPGAGPIQLSLESLGTILGSEGLTGLPANSIGPSGNDQLIDIFSLTGSTGGSIPNNLSGMISDLQLVAHTDSSVSTFYKDITPGSAPLTLHPGDYLFYAEAGANMLTGGPAGSGGSVLLSSSSGITNSSSNWTTVGGGNPSTGLSLQPNGSSVTVDTNGNITSGTPDNFTNAGNTLINTTDSNISLAAKLLPFATSGVPAGTPIGSPNFTVPTATQLSTVQTDTGTTVLFVEQVTFVGSGANATATLEGAGMLTVVGGASYANIAKNQTLITGVNESGSSTTGTGDISIAIRSTGVPLTASGNYSTWQTTDSDPANYIGTPEPASIVLLGVGLFGFGVNGVVRRLRKRSLTA